MLVLYHINIILFYYQLKYFLIFLRYVMPVVLHSVF